MMPTTMSSLVIALGDLLLPKQRVDQAGLANIGVAEGADSQHFPLLVLRVKIITCEGKYCLALLVLRSEDF